MSTAKCKKNWVPSRNENEIWGKFSKANSKNYWATGTELMAEKKLKKNFENRRTWERNCKIAGAVYVIGRRVENRIENKKKKQGYEEIGG